MSKRDYPRLGIKEFGEHLISTLDLDPVYVALPKVFEGDRAGLSRWLVAYWCTYHCGAACYISEGQGEEFWTRLRHAAENMEARPAPHGGRWPRGHERRHWRGTAAVRSWKELHLRYENTGPQGMLDYLEAGAPSFKEIVKRVKEHFLFGDWIGFKIADMIDRVLGTHVDFSTDDVFFYKDPYEAALRLWRLETGLPANAQPKDDKMVIREVVGHCEKMFGQYWAPPLMDRSVGLQEIETVLCKWKSHQNGHYPLGNDLTEIAAGLREWAPYSKTAIAMIGALPNGQA